MDFPEKIVFRLRDSKTKKIVKNIAVLLILYAHKKNNYSVEAKVSNSNGEVIFTKKDCLRDIESSRRFYLMDYVSSLEECSPRISIEVITKDTIDYVLKDRRESKDIYKGYWDCSEKFLKVFESVDNYKYVNKIYDFSEADLWKDKVLEIELEEQTNGVTH